MKKIYDSLSKVDTHFVCISLILIVSLWLIMILAQCTKNVVFWRENDQILIPPLVHKDYRLHYFHSWSKCPYALSLFRIRLKIYSTYIYITILMMEYIIFHCRKVYTITTFVVTECYPKLHEEMRCYRS